jgi:uncharacterized protein (TIGR02466 family)
MSDTIDKPKHIKSHAVFAPIVDEYFIEEPERLNLDLVESVYRWRAEEQGTVRSNVDGWHSDGNIFKRTEAPFVEICRHFVEACKPIMERFIARKELANRNLQLEGWANVNPRHAYNQIHTHERFDLSGVYYVKVPERSKTDSGVIQFLNPSYRGGPYSDLFNAMHPQAFIVRPREGQMIVFPSAMPHWVTPNEEDEDRISLAFNARLKKESE